MWRRSRLRVIARKASARAAARSSVFRPSLSSVADGCVVGALGCGGGGSRRACTRAFSPGGPSSKGGASVATLGCAGTRCTLSLDRGTSTSRSLGVVGRAPLPRGMRRLARDARHEGSPGAGGCMGGSRRLVSPTTGGFSSRSGGKTCAQSCAGRRSDVSSLGHACRFDRTQERLRNPGKGPIHAP
jgi:hypothetical protein